MLRSAVGAFIGRFAAVIVLAALAAAGFGPEYIGQALAPTFFDSAPLVFRAGFALAAIATFYWALWPPLRKWFGWGEPPPLQLIYDPRHPLGRYGTVDVWNDELGVPHAGSVYRVGVKNNTDKTIKNVQVTLEGTFAEIFSPKTCRFARTRQFSHDLDPHREELVEVFMYSHDGSDDEAITKYGKDHTLKLVASGTDVPPADLQLRFNAREMIMVDFPRDDRWLDWVGCG